MASTAADPQSLDDWLAEPAVRMHHRRRARTSAEALWAAAAGVRLDETRKLGRVVRWRIPGLPPRLTYHEMFRTYPFCVLAESDTALVSGLCGRIWTLARDYPQLSGPDEFAAWDQPGTVRALFAHSTRLAGDGAELVSEARVQPVDRSAAIRLRAVWTVLSPFERLVAAEPLALAARRAEAHG